MSDDLENLYAAPKHEPQMPSTVVSKRPASHRWARAVFLFYSLSVVASSLLVRRDAVPYSLRLQMILFGLVGLIGLLMLTLGKRTHWAYRSVSVVLLLLALRSIQTSFYFIKSLVNAPDTAPALPVYMLVLGCSGWALMSYLFYRFTFGPPSRAYFSLGRFDAGALGRRIKVRFLGLDRET